MKTKMLYVLVIGSVFLAASCGKQQGDAQLEPPAPEAVDTPSPAQTLHPDVALPGEREDASDALIAAPRLPEKYSRQINTKVQSAVFSSRGDDTDDTIGPPVSAFSAQDSVYIELTLQGTENDYLVTTRWIDPDGEPLLENGRIVDKAGTERRIFSLSKPDGWQPGRYRIEVDINGKRAGEYAFVVN